MSQTKKTPLTSDLFTFNPYSKLWCQHSTVRHHNCPYLYEGACASDDSHLYLYGGYDGTNFHDSLHQLDTKTWQWRQLKGLGESPMKKMGCRMLVYDDQLVLFGGYGISTISTQPGVEFFPDGRFSEDVGWTNELHTFSLVKGAQFFGPVVGFLLFTVLLQGSGHHLLIVVPGLPHAVIFLLPWLTSTKLCCMVDPCLKKGVLITCS